MLFQYLAVDLCGVGETQAPLTGCYCPITLSIIINYFFKKEIHTHTATHKLHEYLRRSAGARTRMASSRDASRNQLVQRPSPLFSIREDEDKVEETEEEEN